MAAKVRAVRKVVKTVLGTDDPVAFSEVFKAALEKGELDTVLHVLWDAVDSRVRDYMGADGENLDEGFLKALHGFRSLHEAPELEIGRNYHLRGEKYKGYSVEFLGYMPSESGKPEMARIKLVYTPVAGNSVHMSGDIFQVPTGALLPIETNNRTVRQSI